MKLLAPTAKGSPLKLNKLLIGLFHCSITLLCVTSVLHVSANETLANSIDSSPTTTSVSIVDQKVGLVRRNQSNRKSSFSC